MYIQIEQRSKEAKTKKRNGKRCTIFNSIPIPKGATKKKTKIVPTSINIVGNSIKYPIVFVFMGLLSMSHSTI